MLRFHVLRTPWRQHGSIASAWLRHPNMKASIAKEHAETRWHFVKTQDSRGQFCVSQASMTWIGEIVRDEVKTFNFMTRTNTLLSPYYCIEAVFNHISPRENPRHPTSPHLCCEAFHWTKQSRRRVAGVAIAVAGWGVFPGVQMRLTLGNEALLSAKTFRSIISDYSHQQASNVTSHGPLGLSQPRSLIWMRWILVETTFFIRLFWLYTPQDHRMHCMVYISTFTIEIQQMWANIPYIDHIGATCWFQILCCACYQCVRVCVVIRIDL